MPTYTNPPLPPYPWLVQSEPPLPDTQPASREIRQNRSKRQFRLGIEVGIAVLCGGTSFVLLWPFAQPDPALDLVGPAQTALTAVAPAPADTGVADRAALIVTPPAMTREAATPATLTKGTAQTPIAAPLIGSSSALEEAIATDAVPVVAPAPPPVAETSASAATIAEFRSVMEEGRDAARLVIRLASRQRPPHNASAEEWTGYRLRQQNADTARRYRKYLDALARSMRGSPSHTVGQQCLERARQTHAYLTTMLEDSQASLQ